MLTGKVHAVRDIWLIGDSFLAEIHPVLNEMSREKDDAESSVPYMYKFFNVSCFVTNPLCVERSKLTRILNALIEALNQCKTLPRLIVMLPDTDLIEQIDLVNPGKCQIMGACFDWLLNNAEKVISAKKEGFRQIRLGAVLPNEPKLVWVCPLTRNEFATEAFVAAIEFLNNIMEDVLAAHRNNYIICINARMDETHYFTSHGDLSGHGKVKFWRSLDRAIEQFNKHEVSLRPISNKEKQERQQCQQQRQEEHQCQLEQRNNSTTPRFPRWRSRGRGCKHGHGHSHLQDSLY